MKPRGKMLCGFSFGAAPDKRSFFQTPEKSGIRQVPYFSPPPEEEKGIFGDRSRLLSV